MLSDILDLFDSCRWGWGCPVPVPAWQERRSEALSAPPPHGPYLGALADPSYHRDCDPPRRSHVGNHSAGPSLGRRGREPRSARPRSSSERRAAVQTCLGSPSSWSQPTFFMCIAIRVPTIGFSQHDLPHHPNGVRELHP
jgi:hypothetical protein